MNEGEGMTSPYGQQYEKEQKKKRELQRRVLEHLKEYSPQPWDILYTHFDQDRNANIAPALQDLSEYGDIAVDKDMMVSITASGLTRLDDRQY